MAQVLNGETIYCAEDIKRALARRHKDDMYFTEVKDGSTAMRSHHSRIDALAIKISWASYQITGYEVKVARSDFLRDEKWQSYLPMCNQLYFAVAPGVCDKIEVPDCCGLLQITSTGTMRMLKKAPWREIEPPVEMYKYLMFEYIGRNHGARRRTSRVDDLTLEERAEVYKAYLDGKKTLREIGYEVSRKMRREIETANAMQSRAKYIIESNRQAEAEFGAVCGVLGIDPHTWDADKKCVAAIEEMKKNGGMTPAMKRAVEKVQADAAELLRQFGGQEAKT